MLPSGLFAAIPTPVHNDGRPDFEAFDRLVDFVCGAGVDGICVGGATSEYPHFDVGERIAVIRRAAERLPVDRSLLVGIGAPSIRHVLELGEAARAAGSRAVLLPMPMFFRYEQEDLHEYCSHIAGALRWPCLLYDLPAYTNPLLPDTALALLREQEFIVGIKDSSGVPENLARFAEARRDAAWSLLVGDDRLLRRGLETGWDGAISGVAACCPELLFGVFRSCVRRDDEKTARLQSLVDEFVDRLVAFPAPWGIRIALAARGLPTGPLPLPLSVHREHQIGEFRDWFGGWMKGLRGAGVLGC